VSAPNVVPSQPTRYRSFFGPVVLIAIGVTALLCTTGVISFHSAFWWFVRYWPVWLIVMGVVKLAEYLWAKQKGYAPPRLGAGVIVFLVFFIIFAATVSRIALGSEWQTLRAEIERNTDHDIFDFFNTSYDFTDTFAQPLAEATEIKVLLRRGDVTVTASPDNQVHAVISKKLRSESQATANSQNDATHPKFQQQGSIWIMDLTNSPYDRGRFDLELQIPPGATLSLNTGRGDLNVSGRDSNVNLSTDNGDVTVTGVKGDAFLHLRSGSATVKEVAGNVQLDGVVEDSSISGVGGTLEFNAGYNGDVELARIGKALHFKSVRTDLQAAKVDGEITMDRGDFHARSVSGPFRLQTRSKDIRLEEVSGDIQVENRNGLVEVHTKTPLGAIAITNFHGGIELNVPENAAFQLDAESKDGEIDSSGFSVTQDNRSRNASAKGTVGKGGPEVRLRTERGTIQIRKQ
jgi:DUF4097 and DUF4098 domain-containing protein YvlB